MNLWSHGLVVLHASSTGYKKIVRSHFFFFKLSILSYYVQMKMLPHPYMAGTFTSFLRQQPWLEQCCGTFQSGLSPATVPARRDRDNAPLSSHSLCILWHLPPEQEDATSHKNLLTLHRAGNQYNQGFVHASYTAHICNSFQNMLDVSLVWAVTSENIL